MTVTSGPVSSVRASNRLDTPTRRAIIRCPHCAGCLHFEPEPLDGSVLLKCLNCSRTAAFSTVDDLIDTFGLDPRDAQLAACRPISFVWRRP